MKRIVVGAKAGADQPWLADAAADLAQQTGADVAVVSLDALELEALSTVPRSELAADARAAVDGLADRIRRTGTDVVAAEQRSGPVVRGILLFAEEHEADLIVVGATTRGPIARRVLGTVSTRLVERSRRPVLVIAPPGTTPSP